MFNYDKFPIFAKIFNLWACKIAKKGIFASCPYTRARVRVHPDGITCDGCGLSDRAQRSGPRDGIRTGKYHTFAVRPGPGRSNGKTPIFLRKLKKPFIFDLRHFRQKYDKYLVWQKIMDCRQNYRNSILAKIPLHLIINQSFSGNLL